MEAVVLTDLLDGNPVVFYVVQFNQNYLCQICLVPLLHLPRVVLGRNRVVERTDVWIFRREVLLGQRMRVVGP